MTYIRLDDGFANHPKIARLAPPAVVLFVAGLCYCSRYLTDGAIPAAAARKLDYSSPRAIGELVAAGLWERRGDDFEVHDYLKHQRSKAQVEAARESGRRRWHRFASNDRATPQESPLLTPLDAPNRDVSEGRGQSDKPKGLSARAPRAPEPAAAADDPPATIFGDAVDPPTACYRAWTNQSPGGLNGVVQGNIDGLLADGVPAPLIVEACRLAGEAGGNKPWRYVERIIERLRSGDQGRSKGAGNLVELFEQRGTA